MRKTVPDFIGMLTGLAAMVAITTTSAAATGISVAGGELDPAVAGGDVYREKPASASAPPGQACLAARRYVEYINAGQTGLVTSLFADGAVVVEPARPVMRGIAEIRAFYNTFVGTAKVELVAVAYLGNRSDCMVEIAITREVQGRQRYALVAIDHFTVGSDGKVVRLVAFVRPPRTE